MPRCENPVIVEELIFGADEYQTLCNMLHRLRIGGVVDMKVFVRICRAAMYKPHPEKDRAEQGETRCYHSAHSILGLLRVSPEEAIYDPLIEALNR